MLIPLGLSVFAALAWATSGTIIKSFSTRFKNFYAALAVIIGNFAAVSVVMALLGLFGHFSISAYAAEIAALSGLVTTAGYLLFYWSLQSQQASNTYAMIEIQAVVLALYAAFALHESVGTVELFGLLAVVIGVIIVSTEKGFKFNKRMLPAMAANLVWALGWILLVYPISVASNSAVPIWISFTVGLAAVAVITPIYARRRGHSPDLVRKGMPIGIAAGLFSGAGNLFYAAVIAMKQLALGAVTGNSSPAIVAVFAHFIYHDRLTKFQILGLMLVLAGGIAVGLY